MNSNLSVGGLIEIVIIMAGIYAALSWIISAAHERIADFLKLRGAKLYQGVLNLLCGHADLAAKIFAHPMIASTSDDRGKKGRSLCALLSIAPNADAGAITAADGTPVRTSVGLLTSYRPSYLDARNFSLAFWQSLGSLKPPQGVATSGTQAYDALAAITTAPRTLISDLQISVSALEGEYPSLYEAVTALLGQAGDDYEKLLTATDAWFNAQMDRVSGWYTRQTQWIIAFIALCLVLLTGIDSAEIVKVLYVQPALRSALTQRIGDAATKGSTASCPSATPLAPMPTGNPGAQAVANELCAELPLMNLGGWIHWLSPQGHWVGMFVTFVALSIGGPFWFDLLKALVNVRAAGPKPDGDDSPKKK